jgi:hypothetical protein
MNKNDFYDGVTNLTNDFLRDKFLSFLYKNLPRAERDQLYDIVRNYVLANYKRVELFIKG